MIVPIILISLGAIVLTFFLIEKIKAYSLKAVALKTIASLLFIALGAYSLSKSNLAILPMFVVIALALGMVGDIALDLKYVFKEKDFEFTLAGFISFALGHVFYITGMFIEFYKGQSVLYIIIPIAFGLLMGLVCLLIEKPFKLDYGRLKPFAILMYGSLLFMMVGTAFSMWIMSGFAINGIMMLAIAGVSFAVSDLILNNTYFGEGHEKPFDIISNTVTYYIAQFLIALAILFI